MKGDRASDYNQTAFEGDEAVASYVAGDYNKLGKIALACIRFLEVARNDYTVEIPNRVILQEYYKDVFTEHPCLVIKTDKVYSYTRNNVCKVVRGKYAHTHETDPIRRNEEKKRKELANFIDEKCSATVLFCVTYSWVKTPFLQTTSTSSDSEFFMKDPYTNRSGQESNLGVVESIIFNIHSETAQIITNGKVGWDRDKVIFPFEDSYEQDFGKEIFEKIQKTIPWLSQMNQEAK